VTYAVSAVVSQCVSTLLTSKRRSWCMVHVLDMQVHLHVSCECACSAAVAVFHPSHLLC
jgi:hypothetical protein